MAFQQLITELEVDKQWNSNSRVSREDYDSVAWMKLSGMIYKRSRKQATWTKNKGTFLNCIFLLYPGTPGLPERGWDMR